jgi:ankyrin repeat protein
LDAKAEVNKADRCGETPLYRASRSRHLETVKVLIAANADVNKNDIDGKTPLSRALDNNDAKMAAVLRAAGAKPPHRAPD